MKTRSLFRIDYGHSVFLLALMTILAGSGLSSAATSVWDNGAGNNDLNTGSNWNTDLVPNGATGDDIAQWNLAVNRNLTFDANFGYGGSDNNGIKIHLTAGQTGSVAINKITNGNVRFNQITLDSGSGAFSVGTSGTTFDWFLGGNTGTTTSPAFVNNSANTATIGNLVTIKGGYSSKTRHLSLGGSGNWNISGKIGDALDSANTITLTKTGAGTALLSGANAYTGGTTLTTGTLQAGNNSAFGTGTLALNGGKLSSDSTTARTFGNAVTFGGDVTLGDATNNGLLTFNAAGTLTGNRTLTTASNVTYAGAIGGGAFGLTKAGASTLVLSAANTYTGNTVISAGTLLVNGSLSSASAVQIGASGTLGGHGSVGAISGAGTVAPGNSPGILTALSVDGSTGMDFAFEIMALTPTYGNAANSFNDVLRLTAGTPFVGALDADNTVTVDFSSLSLAPGQSYTGGFYADAGDFAGAISGANFVFVGADGFTISVSTAQQTANFGSGNVNGWVTQFDVVAIPEPSTALLLTPGLMLVLFRRRRSHLAR